jgi:hypothetical protein
MTGLINQFLLPPPGQARHHLPARGDLCGCWRSNERYRQHGARPPTR